MLRHFGHFCLAAGRPSRSRLLRWRSEARRIIRRSEGLASLSDTDLLAKSRELQWQARTGVPLASLMHDAYALVREAARRGVSQQHYSVQIVAGIALFEGFVCEMQTGEGKTLTATLPAYLRALPGKGCHVVTANEYLAFRDARFANRIFERLGLSTACVLPPIEDPERREAYASDVTYGTVREIGFDFLRDRLKLGAGNPEEVDRQFRRPPGGRQPVQRGAHFALVDEADSVLIDEARTPLVIGMPQPVDPTTLALVRWSRRMAADLQPQVEFSWEPEGRKAWLKDIGCRRVLLTMRPSLLSGLSHERIFQSVELALVARNGFERGRDYLIVDEKVVIVDESTGRTMEGRKWQEGLHQAIEAKEHLPVTTRTGSAARITVQSFFRRYEHLAGMTGTVGPARPELRRTYDLRTAVIPTHRPCIRQALPTRIFATLDAKRRAVAADVERLHREGRAILVGTPSVTASEALAALLTEGGIPHQVLNARYHEQEADIVSGAGEPGRVTIATNMAGRGTDILLGAQVREHGGLHVIVTEMHSSARIDRQLIGRCARQGDPGTHQTFVSFEDELLRVVAAAGRLKLQQRARRAANAAGELDPSFVNALRGVQKAVEAAHVKQRKTLLRLEEEQREACERLGLDPWLELVE